MIKKMSAKGKEKLLKYFTDRKNYNNYRGLTLLCRQMKMFEQINEKRIKPTIEKSKDEAQSYEVFIRPKISIKQIIEKLQAQSKKVYLRLMDLKKPFTRYREKIYGK